jgi:hypothetical protein
VGLNFAKISILKLLKNLTLLDWLSSSKVPRICFLGVIYYGHKIIFVSHVMVVIINFLLDFVFVSALKLL